MSNIYINNDLCDLCLECIDACPFNAIENCNDGIVVNSACKMCKICLKKCPQKAISINEVTEKKVNKDEWKGIMVYVEHIESKIHDITYELIGKAKS